MNGRSSVLLAMLLSDVCCGRLRGVRNSLPETYSRTARLPGKEPASGRPLSRRGSGRVTGVARVTSLARNAVMRLWAGLMYPSPAQRRVIRVRSPMAPQDTPERGAKPSRQRRPPMDSGGPEGVSKHPPDRPQQLSHLQTYLGCPFVNKSSDPLLSSLCKIERKRTEEPTVNRVVF